MNNLLKESDVRPHQPKISWQKSLINVVYILLSVSLFLFSIDLLATSFNRMGTGMAESLLLATSNPFISLFIGLLMTALIQSSSTSTSMVVAVVAAGSISFSDAVPMIMGANIGTTLTSTIVSLAFITKKKEFRKAISAGTVHDIFNIIITVILFPLEYYYGFVSNLAEEVAQFIKAGPVLDGGQIKNLNAYLFSSISIWVVSILKHNIISIILSFALVFISIKVLSQLIYKNFIGEFNDKLKNLVFKNTSKAFSFGLLITAGVQSSSITTSLIVPLVATGKVSLQRCFPFILGANIGTTITALIASLFRTEAAISIAVAHLLFNLLGVLIFLPFPLLRKIPISIASLFGRLTIKNRFIGFIYIVLMFFILPFALIFLNKENNLQVKEKPYKEIELPVKE